MSVISKRYIVKVIIIQVCAIGVGVVAALALMSPSSVMTASFGGVASVNAANHCNNFFPYDYGADNNCDTQNFISPSGNYTSSVRHRDGLEMRTVSYGGMVLEFEGLPDNVRYNTNLFAIDGNGTYRRAYCAWTFQSPNTNGRCRSNWHDA
jgi:hypothetical protein